MSGDELRGKYRGQGPDTDTARAEARRDDEVFAVMRDHGSFVMDRILTVPTPSDMVGPQQIIRFLWMAGTIQQYHQTRYPTAWEHDFYKLAMLTYELLDARLSRRWLLRPVEKVGFRAPDSGVTFAAGAITKDDWQTGWLTHREWGRRRSQLPPGQWASAALEPLDDDRPLLRGIDDLREERDQ